MMLRNAWHLFLRGEEIVTTCIMDDDDGTLEWISALCWEIQQNLEKYEMIIQYFIGDLKLEG